MKGGTGAFAVDKVLEFVEECCSSKGDIIVNADQEPSIQYLVKDIIEARPDSRTLVEEALIQSKGAQSRVWKASSGSLSRHSTSEWAIR